MTIRYPDYSNCLVNLACSILRYFGAEIQHASLPVMDALLEKNRTNVVVMLFDGMGVDALNKLLPADSFLRLHCRSEISSVFPPTTTAAVTSVESGLTPAEHGWLGWSLYFSEVDKIVNALTNTDRETMKKAADYHVAQKFLPYTSIFEKINDAGQARAYSVSPFGTNRIVSHDELYPEVKRLCAEEGRKYIYTYWGEPDGVMHNMGCYSEEARQWVLSINSKVEELCGSLKDTLVIVISDHGHCSLSHMYISEHPAVEAMMIRPITIESRAAGFYIKPECRDAFPAAFREAFGDAFLLLSRQDVIRMQLFGGGPPHPKFEELVGDFLAIAVADYGIVQNRRSRQFLSNHAGLTEQEMMIPFIVAET